MHASLREITEERKNKPREEKVKWKSSRGATGDNTTEQARKSLESLIWGAAAVWVGFGFCQNNMEINHQTGSQDD